MKLITLKDSNPIARLLTAAGIGRDPILEFSGTMFGIERKRWESDQAMRRRLNSSLAAMRSGYAGRPCWMPDDASDSEENKVKPGWRERIMRDWN